MHIAVGNTQLQHHYYTVNNYLEQLKAYTS
jgi:hypothetical protein